MEDDRRIIICSLRLCGCQGGRQPVQPGDKGDQLRCIGNIRIHIPGMNNEGPSPAYFIRLLPSQVIIKYFVWGEGTGQGRLIERVGVWYRHRLSIPVIGGNWWDQVARSNPETSSQKNFNCKNPNGFSTWYIFCFCPLLDVSLTGDQRRPGPGLDDKCCE